jgi:hypothetical protein
MLAAIIGARRPTVSTALGALRDDGLVERIEDGWLLRGEPPQELHDLRSKVAARAPMIGFGDTPGGRGAS